ncbi:hypothetical protein NEFER03_1301 [Nematocida sp. LUAm3]|nr:hypothetical protein NEFER03_1301 [Nematocida sp. LUAm3]KAI5174077.1 hypothetical protein NEFER02_0544 [Nematocida sp. LUAm2]KAI5177180.1 hypothetical protein NEFER01_0455 [Nematocida sp. LUAm1]
MKINLLDILPEDQQKLEKESLFLLRNKKPLPVEEKKKEEHSIPSSLLEPPIDSELEENLFKLLRSHEEVAEAQEQRRRRILNSDKAKKNIWSKKIKSKNYRKLSREEKIKQRAINEQLIENLTEEVEETPQQTEEYLQKEQEPVPEAQRVTPVDIFHSYAKPKNTEIEEILGVDKEFEEEKRRQVERDLPKEEEEIIPGWNSWGGTDIKPVKTSMNHRIHKRSGIAIRKRKDFLSSHVIYNERIEKTRNQKYASSSIPYGYSSPEDYQEFLSVSIHPTETPINLLKKIIKNEKDV